jgi:hypothetical protein
MPVAGALVQKKLRGASMSKRKKGQQTQKKKAATRAQGKAANASPYWQQGGSGDKSSNRRGANYASQPRSVGKQYWRQ